MFAGEKRAIEDGKQSGRALSPLDCLSALLRILGIGGGQQASVLIEMDHIAFFERDPLDLGIHGQTGARESSVGMKLNAGMLFARDHLPQPRRPFAGDVLDEFVLLQPNNPQLAVSMKDGVPLRGVPLAQMPLQPSRLGQETAIQRPIRVEINDGSLGQHMPPKSPILLKRARARA